jgi:hypothetical protein
MNTATLLQATLLTSGIVASTLQEATRAMYMVVGPVGSLIVFDRYERRLTPEELSMLDSFAPMRVIAPSHIMGDGYSRCMFVEIDDERYYVQIGENGALLVGSGTITPRMFADVMRRDDSVRVVARRGLLLTIPDGREVILQPATVVKRYFTRGDRSYVGTSDSMRVFGWVPQRYGDLEPVGGRGRVHLVAGSKDTQERITRRLEQVNGYLRRLYIAQSSKSGRHITAPEWTVREDRGDLICTLEGIPTHGAHDASVRMLANEFRGYVLGIDAEVISRPGAIEIRFRE